MKIILFIWNYLLPNIIKNIIKFLIIKNKFNNLTIKYSSLSNISVLDILKWNIIFGKNVKINEGVKMNWIVEIWNYSYINSYNTNINWCNEFKIKIWKFCSIAWNVFLISHNYHNKDSLTTSNWDLEIIWKNMWWDIIIWNDVWVWYGAIILPWVKIWNWAIIWAGSIVTKDIPSYAISAWNPSKVIKYRFDNETIKKIEKSQWRDWTITSIKEDINLHFLDINNNENNIP